ncbi:MAG: GAF domain-containing protein [Desulfovibrionales bacterium]|nr:GAF domain-containing protein [Desulfovibrionales bacterium]
MPQRQVANPPRRKPLRHSGLWGETIRQRKPLVVNSYSLKHPWAKGCPQGHVPLTRYLGIPVFRDSSIVGIVGVANKNTDYTHNDVLYVQLLIDGVWNAIESYQLEQNYEQLFMSMAAGFILLEIMADAAGNPVDYKIVQANPAAGYLFGTPAQSFLGRTVREVLPESELLVWIDRLHDLARTGEAHQFTSFTRITDRYFTSTLYAPQPGHIAIIIHDVTELKKITNQLEKSMLRVQELAEQSQAANRAKSEFLANMSHEIRTPLNGIVGMLQVLETTHLSTDQTQYVELDLRSANRLTRLLSDILDISRIEAGKLSIHTSEFVFTDFKEGIAELFAVTAREKNLSLTIRMYPEQPIRVVADETRLRQILFNLVGNALKFTRHGHVCADVSLLAGDWYKKQRLLICVSDTGPGIPDEKVHEIFDPFTQAEGSYVRTHQGAGLGLSIVRRLVTLMNGVLSFDSRPDEGTSICVSIPVALSEAISLPSGVDSGLNTT